VGAIGAIKEEDSMSTVNPAQPQAAPQAGPLDLRSSTTIQGNILAPFNKDHEVIMFLRFPNASSGQQWLKDVLPSISVTKDVAAFNDQFSSARHQSGGQDPTNLKTTWVQIALTANGLLMLAPHLQNDLANPNFNFTAFTQGAASRASSLGDADPSTWKIGQDAQQVHALLVIAADDPNDLNNKLNEMQALATKHGLTTIREERGDTLPGDLKGHEHFGFKDGISQPGVRRFSRPDPTNKQDVEHPGSFLIFPGEFVLGYDTQGILNADNPAPSQPAPPLPAPNWMNDGSFMVFRRLNQDVLSFKGQVIELMDNLQTAHPSLTLSQDLMGAKLVGRWASGTPLDLAPTQDTGNVSPNKFEFTNDPNGQRCPLFAHIRKVYPRSEQELAAHHRILRRGIPFGQPFDPSSGAGFGANDERGLLFIAFMADIENQFEFLQIAWVNSPFFPDGTAGHDPVIGVPSGDGAITFHHTGPNNSDMTVSLGCPQFVQTSGAVYAFAPSLPTLNALANGKL
jgi:Dyp-type peroxidase family